ncbi:hypothetical protein ACFVYR_25795 [Streptomyces sp. NPDC058284]|uniref:hypothetical protein n=1 Tax=unclassified Streptomyces TaxID=2593676 RepID=UPI003659ED69
MAVRIRSLLPSVPVVVELASGSAVRLSPGEVSRELPDAEVAGSAKVEKLRAQRVIAVEDVSAETTEEVAQETGPAPEPAESPGRRGKAAAKRSGAQDD